MDYVISEAEREACFRDGAVPLRNVVSDKWLSTIEAGVERDIREPGPFVHGYVPDNGIGKFHGNIRILVEFY